MNARFSSDRMGHELPFPEWLRPLLTTVPTDQILVTVETYRDASALAAVKHRAGGARPRLVPSAGAAFALLAARAAGMDDIVTPQVATRGWDADLRPKNLVDEIAPLPKLGGRTRRAVLTLAEGVTRSNVHELAQSARVHPRTLNRRLHALAGVSANRIVLAAMLDRGTYLLVGGLSVTEVSAAVGYSECAAFSRRVAQLTGHSPRKWREIVELDPSAPTRAMRGRHQQPLGGVGLGSPSDV